MTAMDSLRGDWPLRPRLEAREAGRKGELCSKVPFGFNWDFPEQKLRLMHPSTSMPSRPHQ